MRILYPYAVLIAGSILMIGGVSPLQSARAQERGTDSAGNSEVVRILIDQEKTTFTIRPTYALSDTTGLDPTPLQYELTVERAGASTSRSRQSGSFIPTPGRTDTLSTVRINAQPDDRLYLRFIVRKNDRVVAETTHTESVSVPE